MPNLLDLMTDEEREQVSKAQAKTVEVSRPEYVIAKFGCYYGWQAVEAVKRGYVQKGEEKIMLTFDEVATLVEAGDKIHAQKMIDLGRAVRAGVASAMAKNPRKVFESAMAGFAKKAKI